MKRTAAHIFRIISAVIILINIGLIIEKILWYMEPMPGLSEMIRLDSCIIRLIAGAAGLLITSVYLKKNRLRAKEK